MERFGIIIFLTVRMTKKVIGKNIVILWIDFFQNLFGIGGVILLRKNGMEI